MFLIIFQVAAIRRLPEILGRVSAFKNRQDVGAAEDLGGDVGQPEEEHPSHQPFPAVHAVAFAFAEFFAAGVEQQGGDECRPHGGGEADVADGEHETGGEQQAGNERGQEGEGGGFAAAGAAGTEAEQVGEVVEQAEGNAEEGGGDGHVGKQGEHAHQPAAGHLGEGGEQGSHVVLRGNHGAELAARQVALHGELPEGVDHQRHQSAEPERAGHFFGVAPEIVEQAGHVAVEAEGGEADGQGGAEVDPVAAAVPAAGGIEQYGGPGRKEQAAVGPEEGHDHAADEDGGAAVYPEGGPPHAAGEDEGEHNLPHP